MTLLFSGATLIGQRHFGVHRNPKRKRGNMLGRFPRLRFGLLYSTVLRTKWRCRTNLHPFALLRVIRGQPLDCGLVFLPLSRFAVSRSHDRDTMSTEGHPLTLRPGNGVCDARQCGASSAVETCLSAAAILVRGSHSERDLRDNLLRTSLSQRSL